MMRAGLAVLFSAFFTATATAQSATVSGIVIDARTERPLGDVIISLERSALSVTTDAAGGFQLTLAPGEYVVSASLVGYALTRRPVSVTAGESSVLTIRLSEGAGQFDEHVTVSGVPAHESAASLGGALLHGRELQALRGITLDDPLRALHALPSAAATDDFYSEFAVRGSPFRHVGLVVDGIPSRYVMHAVHGITDGGSIAMINSDAVGSISLLPGSYPQRWGRRVGAQVGIEMREGDRDSFRARVGVSGTSATLLGEGPLLGGRGSWLVSGRRSYLDLLLKRIDEENSFAFGFTDAEAKTVIDLTPNHQLQALLIAGASKFEEEPDELAVNDEAQVKGRTWLSGVTWRFTPSARLAITQRVYVTGLTFRNLNRDGAELDTASTAESGWRADAAASLSRGVLLELGADVQRLYGRHHQRRSLNDAPELTTIADYRKTDRALSGYFQAVLGSPSKIALTPGLRIDYWGPTKTSSASPWLITNVALSLRTHIRAGTGVYRQFADVEQIAGVHGGGEELRPETGRHFDLGVSQRMPLDLTLQLTGYLRDERDVLWTPAAEPRRLADGSIRLGRGDAPWTNSLEGLARGIEIVLRRDAPSRLSGWAGYAFGRHRYTDTSTGETFSSDYDQRHAVTLFGHYRVSNRTTVDAKFRYGSNYPIVGYIGQQPLTPDAPPLFGGGRPLFYGLTESRNTLRLPRYARLDLRADRTFTWYGRRITLFAEIANALNRQNLRNVPYGVDRAGRVQGATDTLLPVLPSAGFVIEL